MLSRRSSRRHPSVAWHGVVSHGDTPLWHGVQPTPIPYTLPCVEPLCPQDALAFSVAEAVHLPPPKPEEAQPHTAYPCPMHGPCCMPPCSHAFYAPPRVLHCGTVWGPCMQCVLGHTGHACRVYWGTWGMHAVCTGAHGAWSPPCAACDGPSPLCPPQAARYREIYARMHPGAVPGRLGVTLTLGLTQLTPPNCVPLVPCPVPPGPL